MAALRAVNSESASPRKARAPRKPPSITTAARSGDRRRLLVALRDTIAAQLEEGVPPRDLASLSKRVVDIANEIAEIDADVEGDAVSNAADTPDEAWQPV